MIKGKRKSVIKRASRINKLAVTFGLFSLHLGSFDNMYLHALFTAPKDFFCRDKVVQPLIRLDDSLKPADLGVDIWNTCWATNRLI